MNITIVVTNEISSIFDCSTTDRLLNDLREDVHRGSSWGQVLAQVIMYTMLVFHTIGFTWQYLKRVLYMAFYTLIAPLITLTYPLDKIKDGQAQAFSMWIKEYIFTALIQVIHLVIYFVLVGSAVALVEDYAIFAVLVIHFIKKAEDLVKKMFGFEKSDTVGTIGQAATGGLIMNAINMLSPSSKSKKSGGGKPNNNIRTAPTSGGNTPTPTPGGNPPIPTPGGNTPIPTPGGSNSSGGTGQKRIFKGFAKTIGKKFVGPGLKAVLKMSGATALGMLGGAAALIDGDLDGVLTGTIAAGKIGYNATGSAIDFGANTGKKLKEFIDNL
jgi:hypothetical protein